MHGSLNRYQILVTGASGFLGRRLILRLIAKGAYVVGLDLTPFPRKFKKLADVKGTLIHREGDLNSMQFVNKSLQKLRSGCRRYSALFHLSALSHAGRCEDDPLTAYKTNVHQTVQLLEACRNGGLTRVLFPSTALVYGDNRDGLLTEEHSTNPKTIYASSKLAAEALIQGFAESYYFSCDIARLSNVYGSDANPDTAVSTVLRQIRRQETIRLRTLKPVRDFIYCEDVAEGLIRLLTSGCEPGCRVFNLSTGQATTIGEMAKTAYEVAGIRKEIYESNKDDAFKKSRLVLANNKLVKRTGWHPIFSVRKGLEAAWEEMND